MQKFVGKLFLLPPLLLSGTGTSFSLLARSRRVSTTLWKPSITIAVHHQRPPVCRTRSTCFMSSDTHNDKEDIIPEEDLSPASPRAFWQSWWTSFRSDYTKAAQVEDFEVLLFDVFLLLNLVVSISFWVVHRMEVDWIGLALNEGCLLSLCWLGAGLATGAFLYSAVDGHYGTGDERGGPVGAAKLAFHTYVSAINIRLLVALVVAMYQHRPVGDIGGESLLPLELGLGLVLMPAWRMLHSSYLPRL